MFEGYGATSWSMSFPAAIIVEGVPAQPAAAALWRVQMRDQRRRVGTGPHGQRQRRAPVSDPSLRKGSAREPQRLPRRRFPLNTPLRVAIPMKTRPGLAVRRLLPILPRDDRLTTEQTGGQRIADEAVPNPDVDPLALATDGGGLRFWHNRHQLPLARKQPGQARTRPQQAQPPRARDRSAPRAPPPRPRGNHRRAHRHHRPDCCHNAA